MKIGGGVGPRMGWARHGVGAIADPASCTRKGDGSGTANCRWMHANAKVAHDVLLSPKEV